MPLTTVQLDGEKVPAILLEKLREPVSFDTGSLELTTPVHSELSCTVVGEHDTVVVVGREGNMLKWNCFIVGPAVRDPSELSRLTCW